MKIKEIDLDTYIEKYSSIRTNLSDYYVEKYDNILIFGAEKGKKPVGLMIVVNNFNYEIAILESADDKIKKEMVLHLKALAQNEKRVIEWRIIVTEKNHDNLIADEVGFENQKEVNIFRHLSKDKDKIFDLIKRYESIYDNFIKNGYCVESFKNLTKEQLNYIADNPDHVFPGYLRPEKFIKNEAFNLSSDKSFALIKEDKIIGYVLLSEPSPGKYIYEATSIIEKYKRSGVFILPTKNALESIANSDYSSLTFAVYESNNEMLPIIIKYAMPIISNVSKQINYLLNFNR